MSRATAQALGRAVQLVVTSSSRSEGALALPLGSTQWVRQHGGGVPEHWGRDSPYHPGTGFLGTPPDHLERVKKRPVSPHVFEADGTKFHYAMPINAITSIMNRATGVALTVGMTGAGAIALTGDLPATIEAIKHTSSVLLYPIKAAVAFPLLYHYLGGLRHVFWDKAKYGNQADKNSPLENKSVDQSSKILVGASVLGTAAFAVLSFS
ncbi:g10394 [Coccomyxa viridis]|uniref:G10394 protein n=1 Tax=Coccomyxa viridis TaxID=1274662 RepID=A0ABP1G5F3_9CHLO